MSSAVMRYATADADVKLVRPKPMRLVPPQMKRGGDFAGDLAPQSAINVLSATNPMEIQSHVIPPMVPEMSAETMQQEPQLIRPTPQLVRPIALKVARPIPKSAVEAFYDETYRHGIQAEDVHAATILAQEWHRKWTQQDEQGHTMPEPSADMDPHALFLREKHVMARRSSRSNSVETEDLVYNPLDRVAGAKNPSPEDLQEDLYYERKRLRITVSGSISSLSPDSDENDPNAPTRNPPGGLEPPSSKRRVLGFDQTEMMRLNAVSPEPPQSLPAGMVRPVALRVHRPQAMEVSTAIDLLTRAHNQANDQVPADIVKEFRHQQSTLSPLTLPSVTSSYKKLKAAVVEDEATAESASSNKMSVPSVISHVAKRIKPGVRAPEIEAARDGILHRLAVTGGDVDTDTQFLSHLELLKSFYQSTGADARFSDVTYTSEGTWLTLTKPTYFGNLGNNDNGDPMYTLGRMSFDMFSPTRLVCSLQGNFNTVELVSDDDRATTLKAVPKALQEEVEAGNTTLRTYNIITAFTIEPSLAAWPNAPNKDVRRPIRGLMTTVGYTLPDPENPNRQSVWITGGSVEPNDDPVDQREWKRQFGKNPPKHSLSEQAKLLAVKLLMGATIPTQTDESGSMEYTFERPIGGHGLAYVDTLYVDESLRIIQGHRGTIFVFSKLPENSSKQ